VHNRSIPRIIWRFIIVQEIHQTQAKPRSSNVIREPAKVVAVQLDGKSEFARVWVEAFAKNTCGDCKVSGTCGQGVLSRWFQRKARCYAVECERDRAALLNVGSCVEVEIPEGVLTKASILVFLLPLLSMLLGAVIANRLFSSELGVALGGVIAFWVGLVSVRRIESSQLFGLQQPRLSDP